MKVLIVEDEVLTSRRLKQLIAAHDSSIEVLGILDSIDSVIDWFGRNPAPDLIFMDIQLSDGLCFEIFNNVRIDAPVIFTTAFDEYAIEAFKVNSIDYLLKPIKADELARSLKKYENIKQHFSSGVNSSGLYEVLKKLGENKPVHKSGFLVKTGQSFIRISTEEIAWFLSEHKLTYIVLFSGKRYMTDHTLDSLEKELDPGQFFRISRQYIININSVESVHSYFGGSLKLHLNPKPEEEMIVNRRRAAGFKEWMDR